ncbi:MAG: DUF4105 domain-containing protein [Muribaculaceae bacterium]|nr:DUF4105 domain-containing protein [Muribaculaceae bacterium]
MKYIVTAVCLLGTATMWGAPRISLLTVGPGSEMYQLEGHTALRIITDGGEDLVVNWGIFDFNTPNFAYRFIKGETDYSIGLSSMALFLAEYSREGRYVKEQPLNLTPAEADEAMRLIEENLRPENRKYRYNYLLDNCATRPLAIIEKALGADGAHLLTDMPAEPSTIRGEMRQYHAEFPAYQLFIDLTLGSGIDQEATIRQRAFAPLFLEKLAAASEIVAADGNVRPLTSGTYTLLHDKLGTPSEKGIPAWVIVAFIALTAVLMTWRDIRRKRVTKWYDASFYAIYGLLGCLVAFLVFVSEHEATSPNINLMWADPLCLIIPLIIWFKKCKCIVFYFQIINFALILIWLTGQPLFHQSTNLLFITLVSSDMLRSASYIYLNRKCLDRPKA